MCYRGQIIVPLAQINLDSGFEFTPRACVVHLAEENWTCTAGLLCPAERFVFVLTFEKEREIADCWVLCLLQRSIFKALATQLRQKISHFSFVSPAWSSRGRNLEESSILSAYIFSSIHNIKMPVAASGDRLKNFKNKGKDAEVT